MDNFILGIKRKKYSGEEVYFTLDKYTFNNHFVEAIKKTYKIHFRCSICGKVGYRRTANFDFPLSNDSFICKVCKCKKTTFKRHGYRASFEIQKYRELAKKAVIKKYNVDNVFKLDAIKNDIKNKINQKEKGKKISKTRLKNKYLSLFKIDEITPLFSLNEYKGGKNIKYPFRCKKCGSIFYSSVDSGNIPICRSCNPIRYGELENDLRSYFKKFRLEKKRLYIDNISYREIDIVFTDFNIGIELNGLYWHSNKVLSKKFKRTKYYHFDKFILAKKNGISLIQIFEDEYKENKEAIIDYILHLLEGKFTTFYKKYIFEEKDFLILDNRIISPYSNYRIYGYKEPKIYKGDIYNAGYSLLTKNQKNFIINLEDNYG